MQGSWELEILGWLSQGYTALEWQGFLNYIKSSPIQQPSQYTTVGATGKIRIKKAHFLIPRASYMSKSRTHIATIKSIIKYLPSHKKSKYYYEF